jgi:hypothetical protein
MKTLFVLSFILLVPFIVTAQDEFSEFEDSSSSNPAGLEFSGFAEIEQGGNITGGGPMRDAGVNDWMMANRRFRLKTSKELDKAAFFVKLDFIQDDVANRSFADIRELRLTYTPFTWVDMSIGKQVSTWGVGDMLFINDLFPKNWVANFQGRDMESLKDSSTSLRITSYLSSNISFDVVYHPEFTPDTTPAGCYVSVYDPNSGGVVKNQNSCTPNETHRETGTYKDGEIASSLKMKIFEQEASLYYYRGFYKNPKGIEFNTSTGLFTPYYPELTVYGASIEGQMGPGIWAAEVGYYHSREDEDGDKYLIENSSFKSLLGYRVDFTSSFSVGVQWYQETMKNYDEYEASVMSNNPSQYELLQASR